ncbi:hypothetical protein P4S93_13925 [Aneurinibacillus thermoaerophilus]|uniref:hypothetical protein n=1 Tax=Aneurinibacillus thermoaerophilus TaxID=143495 RepID=UPI002E24C173|nr:hypothetical protein [Aneurinibacillus thermoaerophilus]MED0761858.1 hypothetical protein [Aneurinibacillus thermoaerophilus]
MLDRINFASCPETCQSAYDEMERLQKVSDTYYCNQCMNIFHATNDNVKCLNCHSGSITKIKIRKFYQL